MLGTVSNTNFLQILEASEQVKTILLSRSNLNSSTTTENDELETQEDLNANDASQNENGIPREDNYAQVFGSDVAERPAGDLSVVELGSDEI